MTNEQKTLFRDIREAMKHGAIYKENDSAVAYSHNGKLYTLESFWTPRARHISLVAVDEKGNALEKPKNDKTFRKVIHGICDLVDLNQNYCKVTVTDYSDSRSEPQTTEYRGVLDLRLTLCRCIDGKRM